MNTVFSTKHSHFKNEIFRIVRNFKNEGIVIADGKRNILKCFDIDGLKVNFKAFKKPNSINRIVYRYFRKSKARRSFEYAQLLISKNIHTPQPIAFIENHNIFGVTSSFYICEHLEDVFTLRKVFMDPTFKDRVKIIKGYTLLMHRLHESGIEFIDNTSANILIKKQNNEYRFFLVDLNRMNFHNKMQISKRLENLSRITSDLNIIKIISNEYALLSEVPQEYCLRKLIEGSNKRRNRYQLKKKLKFYKNFNRGKISSPIAFLRSFLYPGIKNDNQTKLAE